MSLGYISKINSNCEKQVINSINASKRRKRRDCLAVKKISVY